jgi:hypothetical protein
MDVARVTQLRESLPTHLNAGILMGDGGFCILGWSLFVLGYHPITMYANTLVVVDPERGGPAIEVVAREYDLSRETVVALARCNDAAPAASRVAAVREYLDGLL